MDNQLKFDPDRFFRFDFCDLPYADEQEFQKDCEALVSAYLYLGISIRNSDPETSGYLSGAYFTFQRSVQYFADYPAKPPLLPQGVAGLFIRFEQQLQRRVLLTGSGWLYFRLCRIEMNFNLDDFSFFCLLCSLGCEQNGAVQAGFRFLHQQKNLSAPTIGCLYSLYRLIHPELTSERALLLVNDPDEKVSLLFMPQNGECSFSTPLIVRPHVPAYLGGKLWQSSDLWSRAVLLDGKNDQPLLFCDQQYNSVLSFLETPGHSAQLIILQGPAGCGKKLTLDAVSRETGRTFMVFSPESLTALLADPAELILYLLMDEVTFCIEEDDYDNPEVYTQLGAVLQLLAPYRQDVILLTQRMRRMPAFSGYLCHKILYPLPQPSEAVQLWQHFSDPHEVDPALDWNTVSGKYSLSPGSIRKVLQEASLNSRNGCITPEHLRGAILNSSTTRLSELADRLEPFYSWDDLVLSEHSMEQLQNVCDRIRYKYQVEEQWGFKSRASYGRGVSVLLYGPPGTGKTMSAQVLARELWLPLYRINLSQIISKYIGETAKNLDGIFNEAKGSNVILFFDEADALFSKRTDIKNSNDRHANSDVSYLLQKIEEFSGISILATNLANHFDEAFRRRIQYMINIQMPGEEERLKMWKNAFPKEAPLDPDVDFELLASSLEFSGSVIKSAALQSAFFAAREQSSITMRLVVKAVRAELLKLGKPEPYCLEIY